MLRLRLTLWFTTSACFDPFQYTFCVTKVTKPAMQGESQAAQPIQPDSGATQPGLAAFAKVVPLSPEEEQQMKDLAASFRRRNNKKQ
ncbi:hypothetical protein ABBQ32_011848 [Trebouxia sp. C0010 RCD-2024]